MLVYFACMESLDVDVAAVTGFALFSEAADVELFSVEAGVKSFIILGLLSKIMLHQLLPSHQHQIIPYRQK